MLALFSLGLGGDRFEGEPREAALVEQALAGLEDACRRGRQIGGRIGAGRGPAADLPAAPGLDSLRHDPPFRRADCDDA